MRKFTSSVVHAINYCLAAMVGCITYCSHRAWLVPDRSSQLSHVGYCNRADFTEFPEILSMLEQCLLGSLFSGYGEQFGVLSGLWFPSVTC